uniref:Uncharacterized protein n=1 Tax=Rhizophora mucronata TaxID=61149 RepID=A0A2P2MMZ6_RHIMU
MLDLYCESTLLKLTAASYRLQDQPILTSFPSSLLNCPLLFKEIWSCRPNI